MFLKAKFALTSALLFFSALLIYRLCWPLSEAPAVSEQTEASTLCQTRYGVSKDLFSYEGQSPQRVHSHLESERSILQIYTVRGERRFIENLENLSCQIEEPQEIHDGTKKLRLFKAKEGKLDYTSGRFSAAAVRLNLVKIPNPGAVAQSYLEGSARDISLTFSPPSFHADHFEATLLKDQ